MMSPWRRKPMIALVAVYLVGLGGLGGMAVERMRFDVKRIAVIREYEEATARVRARLMALEGGTPGTLWAERTPR